MLVTHTYPYLVVVCCCVVLCCVCAANSFLAFQKYVSGLLDLLVPQEGVVDNLGKEEILFLGPDEGSADFMEWAAKYSQKRNYKWWRSFTTGKPPAMGGVPHDSYGMTTRGVHRYVVCNRPLYPLRCVPPLRCAVRETQPLLWSIGPALTCCVWCRTGELLG
jgi:hypothetical protein